MSTYTGNAQSHAFFGKGVSRYTRLLKALDPNFVRLDDRELHELLAFVTDYAELVRFYDTNDEIDGDWSSFLTVNVSVILAGIISTDLDKLDKEHNQLIKNYFASQEEKAKLLTINHQFEDIYALAQSFDKWLTQFSKITLLGQDFESQVEAEYFNILQEKVKDSVQTLYAYASGSTMKEMKRPKAFLQDFSEFHSWWKLDTVAAEDIFIGSSLPEKLHSAFLKLRILYKSLQSALTYLVYHFKSYFDKSLVAKSDHGPHIGLLITFLQIFKHIQEDFNKISDRYLRYYYTDVLKQEPKPFKPDQVHVNMDIGTEERYILPKGAQVSGGIDEQGEDIVYQTTHEVELTQAQVKELKTIFVSRRDDLDTSQYDLVTDIYAAPNADSLDGHGADFNKDSQPWPLFGEEQEYKPEGSENMAKARLGWAISSNTLYLAEGNRDLSIKLEFEKESTRIYKRLLLDIQSRINEFRKSNDEPMLSLEETFYERVFNQIGERRSFRIYLSSENGWYEVDANTMAIRAVGTGDWKEDTSVDTIDKTLDVLDALEIKCKIPAEAPAIIGFDPSLHGQDSFEEGMPVAKIVINDQKQPFCYSFLRDLRLLGMELSCKVDRLRKMTLFNDNGMISGSRNIALFGPDPSVGSTFLINAPEIFKKQLEHITFKMQWRDIPNTVEEYRSHYLGYPEDYNPSEYRVHISALSHGDFHPSLESEELTFSLFGENRDDPSEDLPPYYPIDRSTLILDDEKVKRLKLEPDPYSSELDFYDSTVDNGVIKLELKSPDHAFGHAVYQNAFAEAVTNNAQMDKEEDKPIPNSPYTPNLKSLEIGYSSRVYISVQQGDSGSTERLYHLHPFGTENTYSRGRCYRPEILPRYDADGYLFIGLEGIKAPESISMHFQLSNKHTKSFIDFVAPKIRWSVLVRNEWRALDERDVLRDTTDDFTKSGIVSLQLPRAISKNNSILNDKLSWLKVEVEGDTELLSHALSIHTNAVLLERLDDEEQLKVLAPHTLNGMAGGNGAISGVSQPYESFGGRSAESAEDFFSRVSERLKHKNRAISHGDYERLVINEFDEVHQVKCLSYSTNPLPEDFVQASKNLKKDEEDSRTGIAHLDGLSIVVVPRKSKYIDLDTPKFNFKKLERIQDYLKARTSPFVKMRVVNPVYEYIRVLAKVKFIDGHNNGSSIQRLHSDIRSFIAPWLDDSHRLIEIGGQLNENVLQDFIKGLDYVKFLTRFSILHIVEENGLFKLQDTAEEENSSVIYARPWGIFIPDADHEFDIIDREDEENPERRIDTETVIRFQDRLNILGMKKYIKIINPTIKKKEVEAPKKEKEIYQVSIKR